MRKAARVLIAALTAAFLLELSLRLFGMMTLESARAVPDSAFSSHTIVCIGDSFVWGVGGRGFPEQLQDMLDSKYGTGWARVLNYGKPGSNSSYLAAQLPRVLEKVHPDAVIILTGMNNLWKRVREDGRLGRGSWWWEHLRAWRLLTVMRRGEDAFGFGSRLSEGRIRRLEAEENTLQASAAVLPPEARARLRDLYCVSAELYHDLNEFQKSSAELDKAMALGGSTDPDAARGIIRSCLYCHVEDKLLELLKGLGKKFADSAEGNFIYAKVYNRQGRQEEAKKCLEKALSLEPKFWVYHCALGEVLFIKNNVAAVRHFREAMRLVPANPHPHFGLGLLWLKIRNWRDAEAEFRLALHLDPGFTEALRRLADLYAAKGEPLRFQGLGREIPALSRSAEYLKIQSGINGGGTERSTPQSEWIEDVSGAVLAARHMAVPVIVSSYPELNLEGLCEAAEQNGAVYVDLGPMFKSRFSFRREYVGYDELHCNTEGYRLMAEVYADVLARLFGMKQTGAANAAPASKNKLP